MDSLIILMFAAVIILGLVLLVVIALTRQSGKVLDKELYQKDWLAIERSVTDAASTQQFAILQADKLLDKALKERGYAGQTMAERMTAARAVFTQRDAMWAAHKLRNRIAHESNVHINESLTRKALASFKRALRDIGAL